MPTPIGSHMNAEALLDMKARLGLTLALFSLLSACTAYGPGRAAISYDTGYYDMHGAVGAGHPVFVEPRPLPPPVAYPPVVRFSTPMPRHFDYHHGHHGHHGHGFHHGHNDFDYGGRRGGFRYRH